MLNSNTVDLSAQLDNFELGMGVQGAQILPKMEDRNDDDEDEEEEDEVEEVDGTKGHLATRTGNYTEVEDTCLIRAWESVSLDAVMGKDQNGKKYWQMIEDKYHKLIPTLSTRSLKSLQGRIIIKKTCSRLSGCLQRLRNGPHSGATINDYDRIANEMFKESPGFKGKSFTLGHCWLLLKDSEKWSLSDNESPPKKGSLVNLDDDEEEDEPPKGGRNKGNPDGNKKEKERIKRLAEAITLSEQIDEMFKVKEKKFAKHLETKIGIVRHREKQRKEKWARKYTIEERKLALEEQKRLDEKEKEEDRFMLLNHETMEPKTKEFWELRRVKIMCQRRKDLQELMKRTGGSFADGLARAAAAVVVAAATEVLHQASQEEDGLQPPTKDSGDDIVQRNSHDDDV